MAQVSINKVYPHPPEKVWRALTDAQAMSEWLMPNDFEPRVRHRFTFRTDPAPGFDGIVHCEVRELTQHERLSFTWVGGPVDTLVTFTLEKVGEGTRLRMTQTGFRGLKAWIVSRMLQSGFRAMYERSLPAVFDRMDDRGQLTPEDRTDSAEDHMSGWTRVWARIGRLFMDRRQS